MSLLRLYDKHRALTLEDWQHPTPPAWRVEWQRRRRGRRFLLWCGRLGLVGSCFASLMWALYLPPHEGVVVLAVLAPVYGLAGWIEARR